MNWTAFAVKTAGIAVAAFGTVAIANHGKVIATSLGLPLSGVIVIVFFILLTFLAKWTTFGRHVYAVGGNAEAARRAGINVPRIRVLVFMLSGATAAMGGIIFASQVNSVALTFPPGNLLLNAIASAVIGGVSLFGGRGEVRGALLGAILIGTLQNGLNTLNVSNGWIYIITGLVLLGRRDARHGRRSPAGPLRPLDDGAPGSGVRTVTLWESRLGLTGPLGWSISIEGPGRPTSSERCRRSRHACRIDWSRSCVGSRSHLGPALQLLANWVGVIMPSPRLGAQRVVFDEPFADHDLGFEEACELFAVEDFVAHRAVEALDERVLLRAAFLDERRLDALLGQPFAE